MADTNTPPRMKEAHDESEQSIKELEQQVEEAEQQQSDPVPSQKDADETAASGI